MPGSDIHSIDYTDLTCLRPIGRGSFGSVYTATYLGLQVAVKEVRPSKSYNVTKYFERECRLLSACRHPNIVSFMGLCRVPKTQSILIITEFVPNGNLKMLLTYESRQKTPKLSWRVKISLATDAARAIAYLHSRDIIHRDLKGENMLITDNFRLKICDFGFARKRAMDALEMKRISYCGTEGYFAPEIISNLEYGTSADVFSLGIIFCEIVCGRFMGEKGFKRVGPLGEVDQSLVWQLMLPSCPPAFIALALSCCSIKADARPSIKAVLAGLLALEDDLRIKEIELSSQEPLELEDSRSKLVDPLNEIETSRDDAEDSDDSDELQSALTHLSQADGSGLTFRESELRIPKSGNTDEGSATTTEATMTLKGCTHEAAQQSFSHHLTLVQPSITQGSAASRNPLWRDTSRMRLLLDAPTARCLACHHVCLPWQSHLACDRCRIHLHMACSTGSFADRIACAPLAAALPPSPIGECPLGKTGRLRAKAPWTLLAPGVQASPLFATGPGPDTVPAPPKPPRD